MAVQQSWRLVIPNYHPPSDNELLVNKFKRSKLKRECAEIFGTYAAMQGVKRVGYLVGEYRPRRHVYMELHGWPTGRPPDPSNFWKAARDALVTAWLLVDDSARWCTATADPVIVQSKISQTIVVLTDVPYLREDDAKQPATRPIRGLRNPFRDLERDG